jgi:hypothetical protein
MLRFGGLLGERVANGGRVARGAWGKDAKRVIDR